MKIEDKLRIEKEAEAFIQKNVFGDAKYITSVSTKGCYIAGATAEHERLNPIRQPSFYRSPSNDYEEGYRDAKKDLAEQLVQYKQALQSLTEGSAFMEKKFQHLLK